MINKIAYFGDLHLRLYKYHDEYKEVFFNEFIPKLKEIKPDRIVFGGDWAHSKNQATPELFEISCIFLNELTKIAPVVLTLGNHDLLLNNLDRLDILTPILNALSNDKITLLNKTGCYEDENIVWCVWGITEGNTKPEIIREEGKHYIGLQHGPLRGSTTDLNFIFEDGLDIEDFNDCDVALNSDIHKRNVMKTEKGIPVIMVGSFVQQGHGERISNHGFLEYTIEDKGVKFHNLHNDYVFMNYKITSIDDIENESEVLLNL